MLKRDLCPICHENLVAVNYIKDGITHYRNCCASCIRKGRKQKPRPPLWMKSGYKKKDKCEKCGFHAKTLKQLFVWHVDGNLKNTGWENLKTICANCQIEVAGTKLPWKPAPIIADF